MLHEHKDSLTKDEQNTVGVFMTSLKLCGQRCIPPNAPHRPELLRAINEVGFTNAVLVKATSKISWDPLMKYMSEMLSTFVQVDPFSCFLSS